MGSGISTNGWGARTTLFLLILFGSASEGRASSLGWVSATPQTIVANHAPTNVTFVISTTTILGDGGAITLTASSQIWEVAHAGALCSAVTTGGTTQHALTTSAITASAGASYDILTITNGASTTAGQSLTITCTATMEPNTESKVVQFDAVSSTDTTPVTGQIGWTVAKRVLVDCFTTSGMPLANCRRWKACADSGGKQCDGGSGNLGTMLCVASTIAAPCATSASRRALSCDSHSSATSPPLLGAGK